MRRKELIKLLEEAGYEHVPFEAEYDWRPVVVKKGRTYTSISIEAQGTRLDNKNKPYTPDPLGGFNPYR
jgi:hypothetical protein